ncbi:sarcosine oxidase subunit gamma [Marinomonas sp. M1K-6]|uniref:Sarcosine oxidase subunit gamma n=1 Tax=Marinomonas profundi TaxID=2726122 RepID=A0A847R9T9_9GAMM|nr:sarcosine oxidase subunit gamma family protein [Marinomonas profundi]NLQ17000.1 sarcosine oxidase subunit gamma [Marinomonas profundi]UDV02725.1 sarcosine oxidase subunit gamma [Marinomonas profundi]
MSDLTVETMEEKLVTNQCPTGAIVGESPLHHADLASVAEHGPQEGGVYFHERKLMGLLTLRCLPSAEQLSLIESLLGVALPMQPLTSVTTEDSPIGKVSVRWVGPDEWLIIVDGDNAFALESRFHETLTGHFSLVNVSGGNTIFDVSGSHVVDMLKKSTPVDLYPSEFPVGKVVSTVFAKSGAMICRVAEDQFELVVRRSFADYLWLWIQDASREYGLVVRA